ncbi:MAG TPA: hypothetical protein QF813_00110 [Alphaproteobacteria bacterium]|nr:hypothetical protein [Alphaproteobacteria bacterium]
MSNSLAAAVSFEHGGFGTAVIDIRIGAETWLYRAPGRYAELTVADNR